MNKKNLFVLLLTLVILSLGLSGCFSPEMIPDPTLETPRPATPSAATVSGPRLRVQNMGTQDIQDLTVLFPDSQIHFGDVPAGATTAYLPAPQGVYNYAAYRFLHKGQETTQPVIDWMGETPRRGDSFTYVIDYDPSRENMQLIRLITVQDQ